MPIFLKPDTPASTQAARPVKVTAARILSISTNLEKNLRLCGGEGRGIHDLLSTLPLPACIRRAARVVATIRNKVTHEPNFEISKELPSDFWDLAEEVDQWLTLAKQRNGLKISDLSVPTVPKTLKKAVSKKPPAEKPAKPTKKATKTRDT